MAEQVTGKELAKEAGLVVVHLVAVVFGVLLMIAGLAMGVSIVLLPIGIPVGLIGMAVMFWGLFAWKQAQQNSQTPKS